MAQIDLGKIKPVWKGAWAGSTVYEKNDMVSESNNSYICTAAHTADASTFSNDSANWDIMATGSNIPAQTGNSGKALVTDGTNLSWSDTGGLVKTGAFVNTSVSSHTPYYVSSGVYRVIPWTTGDYTLDSAGNNLIITAKLDTYTAHNQSGWRLEYSLNGGSSWNNFAGNNQTRYGYSQGSLFGVSTMQRFPQVMTQRLSAVNSTTIRFRVLCMPDSNSSLQFNRGEANLDATGSGCSEIMIMETKV